MSKRRQIVHDPVRADSFTVRSKTFAIVQSADLAMAVRDRVHEQRSAYNWAIEQLVDSPDLPLMSGKNKPDALYLRLTAHRGQGADYATVAVQRPAVSQAHTAFQRYRERLSEYEERKASGKLRRRDLRWDPSSRRLFLTKRGFDSRHYRTLTYLVQPKRVDDRTLRTTGLPDIRTKERLPAQEDIRSMQVVDTTKKLTRSTRPEQRTFELHLQVRVPVEPPSQAMKSPVGVDMGVVHTATTSGGKVFDHDYSENLEDEAIAVQKQLSRRRSGRHGRPSARFRRARRHINRLRRRAQNRRRNDYRHFAKSLARHHSLVGLEDLKIKNMVASARGTADKPITGVSAKRSLNRSIQRSAWGELQSSIMSACELAGSAWCLVNPRNTSIICSVCEYKDKRNRESQSVFVCVRCGFAINADYNASLNILRRAVNLLDGFRRVRGIPLPPVVAEEPGGRDGRPDRLQAGFSLLSENPASERQ